jgi:hypothetical protein
MKNDTLPRIFKKAFLLTAIISCCGCYALAQTKPAAKSAAKPVAAAQPAVKTAVAIIDDFFKKYKEEGAGPAIDYLFGTNKLFNNTAQIEHLKAKLDSTQLTVGQYVGRELIAQKSASPSLVYYSFLVKFSNQPLRFTIMFYKPENEWVLYRFKYDDQMDRELDEAGRISNKHP